MEEYPLGEHERRAFDGIAHALQQDGSKVFKTPLLDQKRRHERYKMVFKRGIAVVGGGLALLAAVRFGSEMQESRQMPPAAVRATAFNNADILKITGTCFGELDAEEKRLEVMPTYGHGSDKAIHPPIVAYERAKALADEYDIPCLPDAGSPAFTPMMVDHRTVMVSGGTAAWTGDERIPAVSLLDYGTDVGDICHIGGPDGRSTNQAYAEAATQLSDMARMYCPPPSAVFSNPTSNAPTPAHT